MYRYSNSKVQFGKKKTQKDYQNSTSPKDKCSLRSLKNSRVRVFINIHDKIMRNCAIRLRHVQNNLLTSDCQYFHNEKTFVRTTEVKHYVLITKIV